MASTSGEELVIGCGAISMFDINGSLVTGYREVSIWPFMAIDSLQAGMDPFLGYIEGYESCKLCLQFDTYSCEAYYSVQDAGIMAVAVMNIPSVDDKRDRTTADNPTTEELVRVNRILTRDSVDPIMSEQEKRLMVRSRDYLKEVSNTLTYYLQAIIWTKPQEVSSMLEVLDDWHRNTGFSQYIILLDGRFHNEAVRTYAVEKLEEMSDAELNKCLIFLLVAICYEPNPYCPLVEFIIERSVKNMQTIGFQVFWTLKSWMHWKFHASKFQIICEQIAMLSGSGRQKLYDQHRVNEFVKKLAILATKEKGGKKMEVIKNYLNNHKKPDHLPEVY